MTTAYIARLTRPVLIFGGSPKDLYHPARIAEAIHAMIPHSKLVDSPWTEEEFFEVGRRDEDGGGTFFGMAAVCAGDTRLHGS
jgi:hypothetical protein